MTTFISYLLVDCYNISSHDAGEIVGKLGFYSDVSVICFDLVLGTLMDILGRKGPSIFGILVAGISLVLMPIPDQIYPYMATLRILIALGVLPA